MKIGGLNQHCGECRVIEYCGNPYGFCLCNDGRFLEMDEEQFCQIAKHSEVSSYPGCLNCKHEDCDNCEISDDLLDHYCEQIADYVHRQVAM